MFKMMMLPYPETALEPYMSAKTMECHYGKHYKTYLENLNNLLIGTPFVGMELEKIIQTTHNKPEWIAIFNNAGQVYNHEFFFRHLDPQGGKEPHDEIGKKIMRDFGDWGKFKSEFTKMALSQFGSGWIWLIEFEHKLEIIKTSNAETPISTGILPIACLDVWEHSYYLDYQNRRAEYVANYLEHLIKV